MHEKCKHLMANGFIFKKPNKNIKERKKILGAIQDLPANQHSQSSPMGKKLGWIGYSD
jgi:hypothetical protein